jgi:5-carboxymethyl-2-hydroxymuconate isomerase
LYTRLGKSYPTLGDLLEAGALGKAQDIAKTAKADYAVQEIEFLPPIPRPEKILCVGLNYMSTNQKYEDKPAAPKYPSIFMRVPGSLVGHTAPIVRPAVSPQLDYEGEIAIVIGTAGRGIPEERAASHIAGLTCINEGSVRDWMHHGKFNVTQGKNFDRSGAIGPWLVTADEFTAFDRLRITTRVNGEIRQEDTTANLVFPFAYLIRYLSTFTTLRAGDIIATGTPSGAGAGFDPPRYLKPGDIVEIEVGGIGKLVNPVIEESPTTR